MSKDISRLINDWQHGDGPTARRIRGDDGREKIQIRVCIDSFHGILQFECDGRPDSKRPHGFDFYFDYLEAKMRKHVEDGGREADYKLTRSQCKKLFEESSQVYHRYVVLLQMGDYDRVVRDTTRNMKVFRFAHDHGGTESDRNHQECWWPYILRIHFTAVVMKHLEAGDLDAALDAIAACRRRIQDLPPQENEVFVQEKKRSLDALEQMEKEIRGRRPLSELEQLEKDKAAAIAGQRYEEAARLRDRINELRNQGDTPPKIGD